MTHSREYPVRIHAGHLGGGRVRAVQTVRTVTSEIACLEDIGRDPKFSVGQWCHVYSGRVEGHDFVVRDIRWNHDHQCFQYLYPFLGGWLFESELISISNRGTGPYLR